MSGGEPVSQDGLIFKNPSVNDMVGKPLIESKQLFNLEYFGPIQVPTVMELLNSFLPVLVVSFLVALISVPIVRYIAVRLNVVDNPDGHRKVHTHPVAYLGGVGVFAGIIGGIVASYLYSGRGVVAEYPSVPFAIIIGMFAIVVTGLMDDVWGWDPNLKIAGQLIAAAGLAISDVGTQTAQGFLMWFFQPEAGEVFFSFVPESWFGLFGGEQSEFALRFGPTYSALYYWVGVFLIAAFVIGACNAANLVDGLDGLLAGSTSIMGISFLVIAIIMAIHDASTFYSVDELGIETWDPLAGTRIVLALCLIGSTLGFLPYNFNPAVIFLGDAGSMLLGYICAVLILTMGAEGNTQLVIAGLIVFAFPIMDTLLAILRRKLSGLPMSAADNNHIHHMVLRSTGSVPKSVLYLYLISLTGGVVGVSLVIMNVLGEIRILFIYSVALLVFGVASAIALKTAIRYRWSIENTEKTTEGSDKKPS